jgi:flagellar protein FlaI
MFDLIRAALRQRPRVIIVGEVRGKEAYSLFQAMATGHTAYATVHASTIHTLIQRLENPPIDLPRALLTSLDIIVFQNAVDMGGKMVRRMTSVTEIIKLDTDTNQLIFMAPYTWVSKTDDRFDSSGSSKILNRIKQQNDWTDEQLQQELNNRILVLEWMRKKNIRGYKEFGTIIAEYKKFPEKILEMAMRDLKE